MTRKDFIAIADAINATDISLKSKGRIATRLADYFIMVNPRFNRLKFLKACGVV